MYVPIPARWALAALVGLALLLGATTRAVADEAEEEKVESKLPKTATIVVWSAGETTEHRVVLGPDGKWVVVGEEPEPAEDDPEEAKEGAARVVVKTGRRLLRVKRGPDGEWVVLQDETESPALEMEEEEEARRLGLDFGTPVPLVRGPGGEWIVLEERAEQAADDEDQPQVRLRLVRPGAAAAGKAQGLGHPRSPIPTLLRWLLTQQTGQPVEGCPFEAWFAGGEDVPLAGLRDALRADGWTGETLRSWVDRHLGAHPRPRARAGRAPWGPARGPMGGPRGWGAPWGGGRGGPWGAPPPPHVESRTILLWNDGSGWQHREIPGGPAGGFGGWMPPPWMWGQGWGPGGFPSGGWGGASGHRAGPGAPPPSSPLPPEVRDILRELLGGDAPMGEAQRKAGARSAAASDSVEELLRHLPPALRETIRGQIEDAARGFEIEVEELGETETEDD